MYLPLPTCLHYEIERPYKYTLSIIIIYNNDCCRKYLFIQFRLAAFCINTVQ